MYKPKYLQLYSSGELRNRLISLNKKLKNCSICPRCCQIDRNFTNKGFCRSGENAVVASYCDHHGEEPPLSGLNGSGTIFFGNCNLKCVYCQNHDISQNYEHMKKFEVSPEQLADIMLDLQNIKHCHNINFVSPSHFVPQIVRSIYLAIKKGLYIPLIYNSNGYDTIETIQLLDGIIDIYLPDLKYSDNIYAQKYSDAKSYVIHARTAIKEMFRQVGLLKVDENGIAHKGLIIRHLVLPNNIAGTQKCLSWISNELSNKVTVSLMAQYYPANRAEKVPILSRRLHQNEYEEVIKIFIDLGFENGLCQNLISSQHYRPHFFKQNHPFE